MVEKQSTNYERYTPEYAAKWVSDFYGKIGGLTLDPCADGGKRIPAVHHYTKADDGLSKPWVGNVFVNPPYGRELRHWVTKAVAELQRSAARESAVEKPWSRAESDLFFLANAQSVLFLVPARSTDTNWWRELTTVGGVPQYSKTFGVSVCLLNKRLKFNQGSSSGAAGVETESAKFPACFVHLCLPSRKLKSMIRFEKMFRQVGQIWRPVALGGELL